MDTVDVTPEISPRQEVLLPDAVPRGRYTLPTNTFMVISWGVFFFGILLILFGYSAELFALPISGMALASLGVLILSGSLTLAFHGLALTWNNFRRLRNGRRQPERHWLTDHVWDEKALSDSSPQKARDALFRGLLVGAFTLPVGWIALATSTPGLARLFALGLFLILAAICANQLWVSRRFRRSIREQGVGRLEFGRFPFFLNDEIDVTFFAGSSTRLTGPLRVTLRCLNEKRVLAKRRGRPSIHTQVWEVYREIQEFPQETRLAKGLRMRFFIPAECRATSLNRIPPCYWQLLIQAKRPALDLDTEFLVPIYSPLPEDS